MKKTSLWSLLILALALSIITACSGGGGGGGGGSTASGPTMAVITLATTTTSSIPQEIIIAGYDVTINLPAGVTVRSSTPPQTDPGVVNLTSGSAGSSITGAYTPATATTPAKVRIVIAKAEGLKIGEFATVICNIAAGYRPQASDFSLSSNPLPLTSGFNESTHSTVQGNLSGVSIAPSSVVIN